MSRRATALGLAAAAVAVAGAVALVHGGQSALQPAAAARTTVATDPTPAADEAGTPDGAAGHASPGRRDDPDRDRTAWARVPVATVWLRPGKVRPVDRPALATRPSIDRWLDRQTLAQREDLTSRVLTQAVRGEPVEVLRSRAGWSKVRLPLQRGSYFTRGIVGWVRSGHLATDARPGGAKHPAAAADRHADGSDVVRIGRRYLGVRYLWGGMSRRGIDCSGLTYLVFRELGRTLARDAADQSRAGRAVRRADLRPGDLVFFSPGGWRAIHHVGIYAGRGLVLHAPHTGTRVRLTPLAAWSDYWGARRVVG